MKSLTLLGLLFTTGFVQAQTPERVEIERSRKVVELTVALDRSTVRCLLGDYGSESLKISIPQLRGYTVFPQTTRGEIAPCINAGSCLFDRTPDGRPLHPDLIIDENKPTEKIAISIVLTEVLEINHALKTCNRSLSEEIESPVRGLNFRHADGASIGKLDYEECLTLARTVAERK